MIITKREKPHKQYIQQTKGSARAENGLSYNYIQFHSSRGISQPIML